MLELQNDSLRHLRLRALEILDSFPSRNTMLRVGSRGSLWRWLYVAPRAWSVRRLQDGLSQTSSGRSLPEKLFLGPGLLEHSQTAALQVQACFLVLQPGTARRRPAFANCCSEAGEAASFICLLRRRKRGGSASDSRLEARAPTPLPRAAIHASAVQGPHAQMRVLVTLRSLGNRLLRRSPRLVRYGAQKTP